MDRDYSILGWVGAGVAGVALAAILLLYLVSGARMITRFDVVPERVEIPKDASSIKRGRHVAWAVSKCVDCHGEDLGGKVYSESTALGRVAAANLTSGEGGVGDFTDADWVRAIRHGLRPSGTPLIYMPANYFNDLSDDDLGALIAFLKDLPPVDRVLPRARAGISTRFYYLSGQLPLIPAEIIDHSPPRPEPPEIGVNRGYGRYLINVGGCRRCHGRYLRGGPIPFTPPGTVLSADLGPGGDLESWDIEDFFNALREGREPDGGNLESVMPWKYTAGLTDNEITAMWLYLQSL